MAAIEMMAVMIEKIPPAELATEYCISANSDAQKSETRKRWPALKLQKGKNMLATASKPAKSR